MPVLQLTGACAWYIMWPELLWRREPIQGLHKILTVISEFLEGENIELHFCTTICATLLLFKCRGTLGRCRVTPGIMLPSKWTLFSTKLLGYYYTEIISTLQCIMVFLQHLFLPNLKLLALHHKQHFVSLSLVEPTPRCKSTLKVLCSESWREFWMPHTARNNSFVAFSGRISPETSFYINSFNQHRIEGFRMTLYDRQRTIFNFWQNWPQNVNLCWELQQTSRSVDC